MMKTECQENNIKINLLMECQDDPLSPEQICAYNKREKAYIGATNTLQVLMNNGDVLYENDSMTLIYLRNCISTSRLEMIANEEPLLSSINSTEYTNRPASSRKVTALLQSDAVSSTSMSFDKNRLNKKVGNNKITIGTCNKKLFKQPNNNLIMDKRSGLVKNYQRNKSNFQDTIAETVIWRTPGNIKGNYLNDIFSANTNLCKKKSVTSKIHNIRVENNDTSMVQSFAFVYDCNDGEQEMSIDKRKMFPSLLVIARPSILMRNVTQKMINEEQLYLDEKVKAVLTLNPLQFIEWLLKQGLIKSVHFCTLHNTTTKISSKQIKLETKVSSKRKFDDSSNFIWASDCCPNKIHSVFQRSIFEGALCSPIVLLKLLYHWSCQTNAFNIIEWVNIKSDFLKRFYTLLRAVCVAANHEEYKGLLGGKNKFVEVGIVSLGSVSQSNKKRMRAWIIGAMETETKLLRLHVADPIQYPVEKNSDKLLNLLQPLLSTVNKDSTILTDSTLDKSIFSSVGYNNVFQQPIRIKNSNHVYSNETLMTYLKNCIPRMFQTTLSLLSKQVIQQFMDELTWRERWGQTPMRAFHSIINHIEKQTDIIINIPLWYCLSKIANNPFMNWQYHNWEANVKILSGNVSDENNTMNEQVTSVLKSLLLKNRDSQMKTESAINSSDSSVSSPQMMAANGKAIPQDLKKLENYYYGQLDGNINTLKSERKCNLEMKCILCCNIMVTNISMMKHIITHALCPYETNIKDIIWCKYCLKEFPTDIILKAHTHETHFKFVKPNLTCLICQIAFKCRSKLILHMHCFHNEIEMPYECSICKFRSSQHYHVVDHFYEQHNNSEKVQCPLCLKVVSFKDNNRKITQNIYFFLNHIKKHTCKKLTKKCSRCALSFINKGVLEYHQRSFHKSCKDIPEVKRYNGLDIVWMPAPPSAPVNLKYQLNKIPENLVDCFSKKNLQLKLVINENSESMMCCECEGYISEEGHFSDNFSCSKCSFQTCCEKSMIEHIIKFHDNSSKKKFGVGREIFLDKHMRCICGFKSLVGNALATHLVQCKQESVYPLTRNLSSEEHQSDSDCSKDITNKNTLNDKYYNNQKLSENENQLEMPKECKDVAVTHDEIEIDVKIETNEGIDNDNFTPPKKKGKFS